MSTAKAETKIPRALKALIGTKNLAEVLQRNPHPDIMGALLRHVPTDFDFICWGVMWGGEYDGNLSHTVFTDIVTRPGKPVPDGQCWVTFGNLPDYKTFPAAECILVSLRPAKGHAIY